MKRFCPQIKCTFFLLFLLGNKFDYNGARFVTHTAYCNLCSVSFDTLKLILCTNLRSIHIRKRPERVKWELDIVYFVAGDSMH